MKRQLLITSAVLLIIVGLAWWRQSHALKPIALTPKLTGSTEYCLTCHSDLPEISASHPVATFGCVLCHGGERLALDANLAHSSLRGGSNPSDLRVVAQSCGGDHCHGGAAEDQNDHIQRVLMSIQATYTGAISSVGYTFGAQPDPAPLFGVFAVTDSTLPSKTGILSLEPFDPTHETIPALKGFALNCLNCHVNASPREGSSFERFTGCAACHSPKIDPTTPMNKVHMLTTAIPYTQCNTCHNRGNYDLRSMNFVERNDQPITRLQNYYQPIAQFTQCEYTLDCVDCHTRTEAMGDGDIHPTELDAEKVRCKTCHGTLNELPLTKTLTDPNDIAFRLALLNPVVKLQFGDTILITEQGDPLWNTRVLPDGSYELIGKATRQFFTFYPVMGSGCQQDPARQDSPYCHQCHEVER
jgi:hypothetical protein